MYITLQGTISVDFLAHRIPYWLFESYQFSQYNQKTSTITTVRLEYSWIHRDSQGFWIAQWCSLMLVTLVRIFCHLIRSYLLKDYWELNQLEPAWEKKNQMRWFEYCNWCPTRLGSAVRTLSLWLCQRDTSPKVREEKIKKKCCDWSKLKQLCVVPIVLWDCNLIDTDLGGFQRKRVLWRVFPIQYLLSLGYWRDSTILDCSWVVTRNLWRVPWKSFQFSYQSSSIFARIIH